MNQLVGRQENGRTFLALILEPGNLKRLKDGDPIKLRIEDLFSDGIPKQLDLLIGFSDTPIADAREFAASANVVLDERSQVVRKKKPSCPFCTSTVEQMGLWKSDGAPGLAFCTQCGAVLGVVPA